MTFFAKILGYRDFFKREELKEALCQIEGLKKTEVDKINGFIFFDSKSQKTWLIATQTYLYCILDDITSDDFEIRWKMSKEEIINQSAVNAEEFLKLTPFYKEKSGRVDFGSFHKGWLYSKKLYSDTKQFIGDFKTLIQTQGLNK